MPFVHKFKKYISLFLRLLNCRQKNHLQHGKKKLLKVKLYHKETPWSHIRTLCLYIYLVQIIINFNTIWKKKSTCEVKKKIFFSISGVSRHWRKRRGVRIVSNCETPEIKNFLVTSTLQIFILKDTGNFLKLYSWSSFQILSENSWRI